MRTSRVNSVYSLACMFSHTYSLLYEFLCNFYIPPLPLIAAGPVSGVRGEHLSTAFCRKNHATNCLMCLIIMRIYCKMSERCISYILAIGGPVKYCIRT